MVANNEGCQIFAATLVVVSLYRDVSNTFKTADNGFYFLRLDTETADLHLSVLTSYKLHITVLTVADDIAGMIHAELVERTVLIGLGRLVGTVQVTTAGLRA